MSDSKFLSDRIVNLDAVGTEKNTLYYDQSDIRVESVQYDVLGGKYNQSLSSKTFGSTSEITISNSDSVSSVWLHLKLPSLAIGVSLPEAWGYHAIRSINYTWGASTISVVQLSGESIFQTMLLSCETAEKQKAMLSLGGEVVKETTALSPEFEATCLLPLPWSTISDMGGAKKPYDASLLSSPILIQINFHDVNHFIARHLMATTYPNAFQRAEVMLRQSVLTNKANSMRRTLLENPNLMISYPFIYRQDGTTRAFALHPKETSLEITLQSFIEADLVGISFYIVPTDNAKSTGAVDSAVRKFDMLRCNNISLIYNGQVLHSYVGRTAELMMLGLDKGDPHTTKSLIQDNGDPYPTTDAYNQRYYVYYLPFTPNKSIVFDGSYNNTSRYAQQTLSIILTPELLKEPGTIANIPPTQNITFRSQYMYNAMNSTQRGVTSLQFA